MQMRTWSRVAGLLALATYTAAVPFVPHELPSIQNSSLSVLVGEGFPLKGDSGTAAHFIPRATSSSCADGWLCDPTPCADSSQCGSGQTCLKFGSQSICVDSGPTWCGLNPSSLALSGCRGSDLPCCHGVCIAEDFQCCNVPDVECPLPYNSQNTCNACPSNQECGTNAASTCIASSTTAPITTSTSITLSSTTGISISTSTSSSTTATTTGTSTTPFTTTSLTTTTTPSNPTASVVQIVGTYINIGCYWDFFDARVLDGDSFVGDSLTVEKCVELAEANNWKYAGVEFGGECYVGNTLRNASKFSDSDCSTLCTGDQSEYCGNGGRIQVYEDTSASTTTAPVPVPTPANLRQNVYWLDEANGGCNEGQKAAIVVELEYAISMAEAASNAVTTAPYYKSFFAKKLRDETNRNFAETIGFRYESLVLLLTGNAKDRAQIACKPGSSKCKKGYMAHMDQSYEMNFCDIFFDEGVIDAPPPANQNERRLTSTNKVIDKCATMDMGVAYLAKAQLIVHEATHTEYFMGGTKPTDDYAYGLTAAYYLALGKYDRSCITYKRKNPLCDPGNLGKEGICDGKYSEWNADSYAILASGVFFSQRCNRQIPLPSNLPEVTDAQSSASADSCPSTDDQIPVDGPAGGDDGDADEPQISGFVHFGDSFASGMGTGQTSTDKCRVGSNNYGELLRQWFSYEADFSYERLSCSGDTIDGANSQIDQWSTVDKSAFATLTIGGNDLGFSDIVWHCVLTPNTARWGSTNRANCEDAESKARGLLQGELRSRLTETYLRILNKATKQGFKLYVAGYPQFFNDQTSDCDMSSFHYWWGGYDATTDWPSYRTVFLTTDLRAELNALVTGLNDVIQAAIGDANQQYGLQAVYYANVDSGFTGNRWCESGVREPDPSQAWFFLSAWPDLEYGSAIEENAEVSALFSHGSIQLPDSGTCASLDPQADPYIRAMCVVATTIEEDPTGPEAARFAKANNAIASGNVSTQEVSPYVPTRQIKTFHPRTPGMVAYRDAVLDAMVAAGQV